MKKTIHLLALALIFIFSFSSFTFSQSIPSGTARYEALGFNPFIMDAAIDLNRNPAWGTKYINYAFGDLGRYSNVNGYKDSAYNLRDQYIGFNLRAGKQWALGLILNKSEGQIFGGGIRATYEALGNKAPIVPFKALIAYNSSSKVTLGLSPYVAYWSGESTAPNLSVDRSTSVWGATFGILANMSSGWSEGTVGVKFNRYKIDSTAGTSTINFENDGKIELNATYRGWYKMGKTNVNLVPYINFGIFNWEPTRTPALTTSDKLDTWNLLAGIGINFPITEDGMFAGGLSGGYNSNSTTVTNLPTDGGTGVTTYELKTEGIIFPQFNMGVEWDLTDWLIGRFGYSRSIQDRKVKITFTDTTAITTQESQESIASSPDQTMTIGLGWEFGNFSLDGLIGERFIQIGPNIFSGKENDLYGIVSMSYNFKK
ncbi:MAG: hypothetical protein ABI840_01995 [bacterium]